ncbi:MAG: hypothetical protein HQK58_02025 [Deltaproteobacteria bacterium]|nr:hypothetical protein [Deltaproteobacteria bacterium]
MPFVKKSKVLVIDACVARAAGDASSTNRASSVARDCLTLIFQICHRAVFTGEVTEEWEKHQSTFARAWKGKMKDKEKRLSRNPVRLPRLTAFIEKSSCEETKRDAMLKDVRLIEAAMAADKIIIPFDNKARDLFKELARKFKSIRAITWINPLEEGIEVLESLAGVTRHTEHTLGGLDPTDKK